jgi:multicomponent Na+:H+ antiporter subunit D
LWAGAVFLLAREVVVPEKHAELVGDAYLYLGQGVNQVGSWLSSLHNGNLQRYLLWLVTALLLLLIFPLG